jgi:Spy/CpxP family protein refolding chaperone
MTFHGKSVVLGAGALIFTLAMLVAAAGVHVSAQNTNPGPPPFRGRGMGFGGPAAGLGPLEMLLGRGAERLGLSEAQTSQIKSIAESHKSEVQSLMKNVGDARRALITAQISGQPDDQIRQLSSAVGSAETEMAVVQAHIAAQVMQVLTPDQQTELKQMVARFAQRGPGGPHGPRR